MEETYLIKVEIEGQQAQKDLTASLDKQTESIARLREENKKLTKERNEVNFKSAEGKARLEELNKQLDENNKKIKDNVDQYTKQKIGVGDYKAALDKLVPGLGATATGFGEMTKKAMAFIMTPMGATIAVLGTVLGTLTAYLNGSAEGQEKLNKIMAAGTFIFEKVMDVVEVMGEVIFKTLELLTAGFTKLLGWVSPAAAEALETATNAATAIADINKKIEDDENELIVKRAETNARVAKLRRDAIALEGDEKKKKIDEAIKLEEDLAAVETKHAEDKLKAIQLEIEQRGSSIELRRQEKEAEAEVINQRAQADESTLRFTKELEKLKDEAAKKDEERRLEQAKIAEEEALMIQRAREFDTEHEVKQNEIKIASVKKLTDAQIAAGLKVGLNQVAARIKDVKETQEAEATKSRITELENRNRLLMLSTSLGLAAGLLEKDSVAYKIIAASRATIDTFAAATEALPNYFLAALVTATGLANVSKILGVGFADGGFTGEGGKHEVAGVVHRGEYVVPKHIVQNPMYSGYISTLEGARQRGYADGGLVTNSATAQIEQQAMMAKAFDGLVIFTSITDINSANASYRMKENRVTI